MKFNARITYYTGTRVAMSSSMRPREGVTVAAARNLKFGTRLSIPALKGIVGDGSPFMIEDRGVAVESRKASHGQYPVIDVFVSSNKRVSGLAKKIALVAEVTILS